MSLPGKTGERYKSEKLGTVVPSGVDGSRIFVCYDGLVLGKGIRVLQNTPEPSPRYACWGVLLVLGCRRGCGTDLNGDLLGRYTWHRQQQALENTHAVSPSSFYLAYGCPL